MRCGLRLPLTLALSPRKSGEREERPIRTTCPYCGVGCGVLATPDGAGGAAIAGDPSIRPTSAGCARRARRSARRWAWKGGCCIPRSAVGAWAGTRRSIMSRAGLRRIIHAHGPESVAFYLSGTAADRGLLRRQQAGQGLHRHAARRHQLAAVHGLVGGGASPRVRRRHRAAVLRRPGAGRPRGAGRLQCGLVPSGAVPAHPGGAQPSAACASSTSIRAARRPARAPICICRSGPAPMLSSGTACCAGWSSAVHSTGTSSASTPKASRQRSMRRARECRPRAGAWRATPASPAGDVETFYRWWTETRARRQLLLAGREPVGAGHRQGQRHHQLPPRHRAHRQAGLGAAVAHRPAQRHGRARGRRARQHAGRAHGLLGRRSATACAASGARPTWRAVEGLKAVQMFDAIADGHIKALWVMGTNPAVSLPRADHVREAMRRLELLVVSDNVASNDSVNLAHVRLPAAAWGEKDGTVTNSERRISRQRPFLQLAGRGAARLVDAGAGRRAHGLGRGLRLSVARRTFSASMPRLSGFENGGARLFDISGLARLSDEDYDALAPVQWPVRSPAARTPSGCSATAPSRFPPAVRASLPIGHGRLANAASTDWPFVLNTGRVRDQWHTMTRTGLSPRLAVHVSEPFVEMHPRGRGGAGPRAGHAGARRDGARGGGAARHAQREAAAGLAVRADPLVGREQLGGRASARWCSPTPIPSRASRRPRRRRRACRPFPVSHYGFVLSRDPIDTTGLAYWARARMPAGHVTFFALDMAPRSWSDMEPSGCCPTGDRLTYEDAQLAAVPHRGAARGPARGRALRSAEPGAAVASNG